MSTLKSLVPLIALASLSAAHASPRERQRIDDNWRFTIEGADPSRYIEPAYDDANWRAVQLPHDYVVEGGFDPRGDGSHGFRTKAIGWYRRTINPKLTPGSHCWLEFDGIFRDSTIWLNGKKIGAHKSGYTSFYIDITADLRPNQSSLLVVKSDPSQNEGWWYEGGGIYRHVWLTTVAAVHVAHWGTYVTTPTVSEKSAAVHAEIQLQNEQSQATDVEVENTILNGRSTVARSKEKATLSPGTKTLSQDLTISNPRLWSIDSPTRYTLRTIVRQNGKELDRVDTPFGVRTLRFDADKGFFLNGKPLKLKGTANHQDFAGVGVAVTDNLQRLRIRKLKEMGSNAFRCAHNPPNPELLDACDELGMVVLDENRHPGDTFSGKTDPKTTTNDMSEVDAMVLRDRNHPCIIAWSLCNEEWSLQSGAEGVRILGAVSRHVKDLDPSRPTTLAMGGNGQNGQSPNLRDTVDVIGGNYGSDNYNDFRKSFPAKPFMATEFSAQVSSRGIYVNDPDRGYMTAMPEQMTASDFSWMKPQDVAWNAIATREWIAGGFVWSGFDYRGEPVPWKWPHEWPDVVSNWGQMDLCGFPKDAYFYFQAAWGPGDKTVVHVFPHWNWKGQEGKPRTVAVYTNAEEVELVLNGKIVGPRKHVTPNLHVEWSVPYMPGTLVAKAYRDGKLVGKDQVETTGVAASLVLRPEPAAMVANPESLMCVNISLQDVRGRWVPTANDRLTFTVTGPASIVGAGNGDPSCHDLESTASLTVQEFSYPAFNGRAMVVLRPTGGPGTIILTVGGSNLQKQRIMIDSNER